jgi:GR25 family glycosyltransferase involved in LPS biosynthesis
MKIDRALIIRRLQHEISMEYAAGCAKSCEAHGLEYEFIDAVENLSCEDSFKAVGTYTANKYTNSSGNCGCHASHIKAWKRIVEIGKPCIILEHDAIVKGDVTNIDIPDMAVVTFGHRVRDPREYDPPSEAQTLIEIQRSVGVHACGLSPKTAKWLYDDAMNNGISIGVDRLLMMKRASGLPLYVCEPPQVVCWVRASTTNYEKTSKYHKITRHSVTNYEESFTPGWIKGRKRI